MVTRREQLSNPASVRPPRLPKSIMSPDKPSTPPTNHAATEDSAGWKLEHSYQSLPDLLYQVVPPTPVREPQLVLVNEPLAASLGLAPERLRDATAAEWFAGNALPPGAQPIAQAYAGHQFGGFTMLGDGRAILAGEQRTVDGGRFDIQWKGAGRTQYSRGGDGRAVLGPMLREYVISEAMAALGVPTTRGLAVVGTGEPVYRESPKPGAVLVRVAGSHLRVGTFQFLAAARQEEALRQLADYTIDRHAPHLSDQEERYLGLLEHVLRQQAELIAQWMAIGFIHGVMNTDNVSIAGETIDYGPCAFMDRYRQDTVFSSIDVQGRYAYGNQPSIGLWNLARFAEALLPLIDAQEEQAVAKASDALQRYEPAYQEAWLKAMGRKIGVTQPQAEDTSLIEGLLSWMEANGADFTNTFRDLSDKPPAAIGDGSDEAFQAWYREWQQRLASAGSSVEAAQESMRQVNPAVIPRNERVEEALQAAEAGDLEPVKQLLAVLADPFASRPAEDPYRQPPAKDAPPYRTFCGT